MYYPWFWQRCAYVKRCCNTVKRSHLFSSTNESELVRVVAKAQNDFSEQRRYWWHVPHPKCMYNVVESDENLKKYLTGWFGGDSLSKNFSFLYILPNIPYTVHVYNSCWCFSVPTYEHIRVLTFCNYIPFIWYDIFINCNLVVARWQQYSTHLYTNSTQNGTKQTIHRRTQLFVGVRAVPRLG